MSFSFINLCGLPSLVDRGGLLYAHWTFVARLNTIVNFLENIRPLLPNCSHLLQDLVEFLLPKLIHCDTLSCKENSSNRKGKSAHNYELVVCVLKNFYHLCLETIPITLLRMKNLKSLFTLNRWTENT